MKLDVGERGRLVSLLPREGSFDTLRIMHELRMHLSFTEEERQETGFSTYTSPDGLEGTRWSNNIVKDVPIPKSAMSIIEKTLLDLNKREKLPAEALSLYEKFIEDS